MPDVYDDDQASGAGGRGSAVSTPLHPSARQLDDEDELTPGQFAQSRSKRPKRETSPNRSVGQQRLILKTKGEQTPDASSPAPSGSNPVVNRFVNEPASQPTSSRRPRPLTQHQIAVEQNRRERIGYLLAKRKEEAHRKLRVQRESEIPLARSARLITGLPDGYDSDDQRAWGPGGVILNPWRREDYGECPNFYLSAIRKATRRLDRWDYENANGPKRDRKKEREERQRARQEAIAFDNALSHSKYLTAQKRARATREARKRAAMESVIGKEATDSVMASKEAAAAAVAAEGQAEIAAATPTATPAAASRPSKGTKARATASKPTSAPLTEEDVNMDEGLDDIDRELLGEGSGDEHPERPVDESFVGDGALSSDVDADEEELDEAEVEADVEGDDHSLASEGEGEGDDGDVRNGDVGSEVSSAVGEVP